jgi:DNA polymerase-3 subunit delta'
MEGALRLALPDAAPAEIATLADVGGGSPGRAAAFRGLDVNGLDQAIRKIAATGDPSNQHRSALAQSLATKSAQPRYEAFLDRAPTFIAAAARERRGVKLADAIRLWEQASQLAAIATRQSFDPQATAFEMGTLLAGLAPVRGEA